MMRAAAAATTELGESEECARMEEVADERGKEGNYLLVGGLLTFGKLLTLT